MWLPFFLIFFHTNLFKAWNCYKTIILRPKGPTETPWQERTIAKLSFCAQKGRQGLHGKNGQLQNYHSAPKRADKDSMARTDGCKTVILSLKAKNLILMRDSSSRIQQAEFAFRMTSGICG